MKRHLNIQYLLSFNLLLLLGVMVAMALAASWLSSRQKEKLLMESQSLMSQRINKFFELQNQSKFFLVGDYTCWDDMGQFLKIKDAAWAELNILPMKRDYGFDFAIAYDDLLQPIWLDSNLEESETIALVKQSDLAKLMVQGGRFHWYLKQNGLMVEIFASTVHPTSDPAQLTLPQGIFLVGNVLNRQYLVRLSEQCEADVGLKNMDSEPFPDSDSQVKLELPLEDLGKSIVGHLHISQQQNFLTLFNYWTKTFLVVLISCVALILLLYHLTLIKWVSRPLDIISKVLSKTLPLTSISGIYKFGKEYRQIGEIIVKNAEHRREMVRLKEKAEESDRLKTVFLANMSHEIRTPINGIIGFAELICNEVDVSNRQEFKQIIKSCAHDLLHIMDDIIELAKIDAGALHLTPHHFSLTGTLNELESLYGHLIDAKTKPIRLIVQKPAKEIILFADGYRIKQMLSILLDNAVKFTEKGHVELTFKLTSQSISFKVKDTGIGIRKEKRDVIFERFRQSEEHLSRQHGGNGLGLAIFKRLADMMNASVTMTSEKGKGTTFKISIPLTMMENHAIEPIGDPNVVHVYVVKEKGQDYISLSRPGSN